MGRFQMEVTYAMTIRLLTRIGILVGSAALATLAHGQQNAGDKLGKQSGATAAPVLKIQVQKPIAKVSPIPVPLKLTRLPDRAKP